MPASLALERFDSFGAKGDAHSKNAEGSFDQVEGQDGAEALAPVSIQPSQEQEKLDAALQELAASKALIVEIVRRIAIELTTARQKIISQGSEAIANSAAELLPSLLDQGFVHELSAATVQIANVIEPEQITLQAHPDQHDTIVDALKSAAPASPITVTSDPSLAEGQVRLSWPDGGAEIDQTALLRHAAELFESRLASFVSGKDQDDQ